MIPTGRDFGLAEWIKNDEKTNSKYRSYGVDLSKLHHMFFLTA